MDEFRFAHPVFLLLLLLPPLVALIPRLRHRVWSTWYGQLRYADVRLVDKLPNAWRLRLGRLPDWLRLAAWVLLVIGLARPQAGDGIQVITGQGIDIALAVDISSSMSTNFPPDTRLEAAKDVIADFVDARQLDRIGLVTFARDATYRVPLTLDHGTLLQVLERVDSIPEARTEGGRQLDLTAIGTGIASAANMLRQGNATSQVIILLTDGDNNTGLAPRTAASAAASLDMRVYTVGIGRADEGDLDEATLRGIADDTDGLYFRAEDTPDLQGIYDRIDRLEQSDVSRRLFVRWQDQAVWFLAPALILLLAERILRRTTFQSIP